MPTCETLDLIFKPENAAKLADCGISILDSPQDVVPMVLRYLGLDGDTTDVADYDKVVEAFAPIRQYIATFDNTNYLNAIPNGELCVINSWSGDYAVAKAPRGRGGRRDEPCLFRAEDRCPGLGRTAWLFPTDAPNKDNAYAFLSFMLKPEVIAGCTNFTAYANANLASKPFVDPAILTDPAVYPDEETIKRLWALARRSTKSRTGR